MDASMACPVPGVPTSSSPKWRTHTSVIWTQGLCIPLCDGLRVSRLMASMGDEERGLSEALCASGSHVNSLWKAPQKGQGREHATATPLKMAA